MKFEENYQCVVQARWGGRRWWFIFKDKTGSLCKLPIKTLLRFVPLAPSTVWTMIRIFMDQFCFQFVHFKKIVQNPIHTNGSTMYNKLGKKRNMRGKCTNIFLMKHGAFYKIRDKILITDIFTFSNTIKINQEMRKTEKYIQIINVKLSFH